MSSNEELIDQQQMAKFFRSFELSTEYREIITSDSPLRYRLLRLIKVAMEYQFLSYYFSHVPEWRLFYRELISKERIAPNYVMTGPGKSGSSDLVSHLLVHPNVVAPLVKEPEMHKKRNWRMCFPTVKEIQKIETKIDGPIRCGYLDPELHSLYVMDTLYDLNPNCKIIVTLRDPVARAYSYWKWEVFVGGKKLQENKNRSYFQSFSEYIDRAVDLFPSIPMETVCGRPVLETGIYYKAVEHWINRFGRENVMVLDAAEYFQDRQQVLEKVQKFLGLPVIHIPEYDKKANENPIKLPPPDRKTNSILTEFYKPYNQKLFDILKADFNWQ